MRMIMVALVGLAVACGGTETSVQTESARPPAAGAPAPGAARPDAARPADPASPAEVHEVRMGLAAGQYFFEPATLTIQVGDTVRWININGGPHNVQFKQDQVPPGAAEILNAAMPGRLNSLYGPFLVDSLARYEVSFAGVPPGTYTYVCSPHEMLGMTALLIVAREE